MKKGYAFFMVAVCAMLILDSCSVEKRHYRKGYHIEWKQQVKTSPAADEIKDVMMEETAAVDEPAGNNDLPELQQLSFPETPLTILPQQENSAEKVQVKKSIPGKTQNKTEYLIYSQKIVIPKAPGISPVPSMSPAISDDGRLVFGIIFLLLGLSPFAVLVYLGPGGPFNLDLGIWAAGLILLLLGIIVDSVGLLYAGWIFLLAAWIYAIVAMVKYG